MTRTYKKHSAVKSKEQYLIDMKSAPCTDCGRTFPTCAMDFDHLPEYKKEYKLALTTAKYYSWEIIKAEVAKCEVVCAVCHRIRTHMLRR